MILSQNNEVARGGEAGAPAANSLLWEIIIVKITDMAVCAAVSLSLNCNFVRLYEWASFAGFGSFLMAILYICFLLNSKIMFCFHK